MRNALIGTTLALFAVTLMLSASKACSAQDGPFPPLDDDVVWYDGSTTGEGRSYDESEHNAYDQYSYWLNTAGDVVVMEGYPYVKKQDNYIDKDTGERVFYTVLVWKYHR